MIPRNAVPSYLTANANGYRGVAASVVDNVEAPVEMAQSHTKGKRLDRMASPTWVLLMQIRTRSSAKGAFTFCVGHHEMLGHLERFHCRVQTDADVHSSMPGQAVRSLTVGYGCYK